MIIMAIVAFTKWSTSRQKNIFSFIDKFDKCLVLMHFWLLISELKKRSYLDKTPFFSRLNNDCNYIQ